MTRPQANVAASSGWAPRLAQESRLADLDRLLARARTVRPISPPKSNARRCSARSTGGKRRKQAFIDILRRAPTHFSALNEFGTLLAGIGAIDAACRVYAEAILHHPGNPMGHVNLGQSPASRQPPCGGARALRGRLEGRSGPRGGASGPRRGARRRRRPRRRGGALPQGLSRPRRSRRCPIAATGRRSRCCNWSRPAAATFRPRRFSTIACF